MIRTIKKTLCFIFEHHWVKLSEISMSHGIRGKGYIIWEECERCGKHRSRWLGDVNISQIGRDISEAVEETRAQLRPELVDEIDEALYNDRHVAKTTKPKATRTKKAATGTSKERKSNSTKVQKPKSSNKS